MKHEFNSYKKPVDILPNNIAREVKIQIEERKSMFEKLNDFVPRIQRTEDQTQNIDEIDQSERSSRKNDTNSSLNRATGMKARKQ